MQELGHPARTSVPPIVPFSGALLALLLAALDQTIVATALPQISADLHAFDQLSWVVTAYLLTSTVTIPIYGTLSDLYGRKQLLVVAIVIFLVGSALCGLAQSIDQLIAFRALQGVGAGGLIPLTAAVIGDLFSPRERGRFQGLGGATWAVAALAGPLLGGVLADAGAWRWIFFINIPLGGIALVVVLATMRIPVRRRQHSTDYGGAVVLTAGATCLVLAAVWGGAQYAWSSPQVLALLGAGILLAVGFVLLERRAAEPLIPLRLFADWNFRTSSAASTLGGGLFFATLIFTPLFVQGVNGGSATSSGATLIPLLCGWVFTSIVFGQVISRTGRYRFVPIFGGALLVVGTGLLTRIDVDTSTTTLTVAMLVIGLGLGCTFQVYMLATQNSVEPALLGIATALMHFFRSLGGMFSVAVLGTILTLRLDEQLTRRLGADAGRVDPQQLVRSPSDASELPAGLVSGVRLALASSLHSVFLVCLGLAVATLVLSALLEELPLGTRTGIEARSDAETRADRELAAVDSGPE